MSDPGTGNKRQLQITEHLTRNQSTIQAYAFAILRDFHLAEDIYQEVATVVLDKFEEGMGKSGFTAWAKQIARNKSLQCLEKRRKGPRTLSTEVLEAISEAFTPEKLSRSEALMGKAKDCVAQLPEQMREVVQMRYNQGLSCDSIGDKLSRTTQAIYSLLKRAKVELQQCMEKGEPA